MVEGLKVTIHGAELRKLCEDRAAHHRDRALVYAGEVERMEASKVEGMQYTSGDPVRALKDKGAMHESSAEEMAFIAEHLDMAEKYLLDMRDLEKLGIVHSRF